MSTASALAITVGIVAVGILAEILQRRRDHLGRRVEEMHAAGGQLFHVRGIEDQVQRLPIGASSPSTSFTLPTFTPMPVVPHM